MSVLSAIGKILGGIILGLFLIGLIFTSGMAQFTTYDNLQPAFGSLISQQFAITEAQFPQVKAALTSYCQQPGRVNVNIADAFPGSPNMTIGCADIATVTSGQALAQMMATSFFNDIYYKNYSCDFIGCLMTLPDQDKAMVVFSENANAFFNQAIMWCIGGIILGLVLLIVAIRKPFGIVKTVGIEMISAGIVAYVGMSYIRGTIPSTMPDIVMPLVNSLFGTLQNNFVIVLAIGILLVIAGFVGAHLTKKKVKKKK